MLWCLLYSPVLLACSCRPFLTLKMLLQVLPRLGLRISQGLQQLLAFKPSYRVFLFRADEDFKCRYLFLMRQKSSSLLLVLFCRHDSIFFYLISFLIWLRSFTSVSSCSRLLPLTVVSLYSYFLLSVTLAPLLFLNRKLGPSCAIFFTKARLLCSSRNLSNLEYRFQQSNSGYISEARALISSWNWSLFRYLWYCAYFLNRPIIVYRGSLSLILKSWQKSMKLVTIIVCTFYSISLKVGWLPSWQVSRQQQLNTCPKQSSQLLLVLLKVSQVLRDMVSNSPPPSFQGICLRLLTIGDCQGDAPLVQLLSLEEFLRMALRTFFIQADYYFFEAPQGYLFASFYQLPTLPTNQLIFWSTSDTTFYCTIFSKISSFLS